MSKIRDNLNTELKNISFDISIDTIRKKAKTHTAKRNTAITAIVCVCIVSVALYCGVLSRNDNLSVKTPIINTPKIEANIPTEIATIQNTFTISACAVESVQNIEESISNAESIEITENSTVQVMEHRIIIEDLIGSDGKTYHIFKVGKAYQENTDENGCVIYETLPIVYVKGNNIKDVKFTADNVVLQKNSDEAIAFFEQASESMSDENNKIYTEPYYKANGYTLTHYVQVPLPNEFTDLCIKCNETDYKFKFSDIPPVTITIDITFENGEVQQKQVQAYYNDEGYFTVRGC